jgi:hypothetical protein
MLRLGHRLQRDQRNSNLLQWPRAAMLPLRLRSDTRCCRQSGRVKTQTNAPYDRYPYGTIDQRDRDISPPRSKGKKQKGAVGPLQPWRKHVDELCLSRGIAAHVPIGVGKYYIEDVVDVKLHPLHCLQN